jgi:hypothetical protein
MRLEQPDTPLDVLADFPFDAAEGLLDLLLERLLEKLHALFDVLPDHLLEELDAPFEQFERLHGHRERDRIIATV